MERASRHRGYHGNIVSDLIDLTFVVILRTVQFTQTLKLINKVF